MGQGLQRAVNAARAAQGKPPKRVHYAYSPLNSGREITGCGRRVIPAIHATYDPETVTCAVCKPVALRMTALVTRDMIITWREVRSGDLVLIDGQLVLVLTVSTYEDDWQGHKWMRTDLSYQHEGGRTYSTDRWADRDYAAVRRTEAAR